MKDNLIKICSLFLLVFVIAASMASLVSCGVQGERGEPGLPGMNGSDGLTPFIAENGNWWIGEIDTGVPASGKNGIDGRDGKDGKDGKDGLDGADGSNGSDGTDGRDGIDGADGKDGLDGKDGVTPQFLYDPATGFIQVSYDNRESWSKLVNINELLVDGKDGITIVACKINDSGELIIEYSDERTENLGKITAEDGKDGTNGITPIISIDKVSLEWNVSYDNGQTWESLGIVSRGNDGINGTDGKNGADGVTPRIKIDALSFEWLVSYDNGLSWEGLGINCKGEPGADGKSPLIRINDGVWEISKNNGTTWESTGVKATGSAGKDGTNGKDGKDGSDGVGIESAELNDEGELIIVLTNGKEFNLGNVKGADGTNGENGKNGVTPLLRINTDTDMWEVSYDSGLSWQSVGMTAGGAGEGGESSLPVYVIPRIRINALSGEWEISYDEGLNWQGLGMSAAGTPGKDGAPGKDGSDGKDGKDGRGIAKLEIKGGHLFVTYTDSDIPVDLGQVVADAEGGAISGSVETDVYTDALAFYPLNGGEEYGVKIGNAIYLDTIVIPSTYNGKPVTTILPKAFQTDQGSNEVLKTVIIPSSVTKICECAFENCNALSSILIPASVKEIENYAFGGMITTVMFEIAESDIPDGQQWTVEYLGCKEILWESK